MIRNLSLTLVAIMGTSSVLVPIQAQAATRVPFCAADQNPNFDSDFARMSLQSAGHKVTSVEQWNGCLRGYVTNANGTTSMAYFDPDTLRQVG
jgi:hypothetical protein